MENRYRFIDEPDEKGKEQHLHTLDGKPLLGTSTVLQVLSKPLTWWASGMAVSHLGWTPINDPHTKKKVPASERLIAVEERWQAVTQMDMETYLKCLDEAYYAHSRKLDTAAEAGTDMHSQLEEYVKYCIFNESGQPILVNQAEHDAVLCFSQWAVENVSEFIASEAHCYSETLWTGGIVDLIYEDKNQNIVMLDFKSAKEAYFAHFLQNAGYDIAIQENGILDKWGNTLGSVNPAVAYGVFPFGMKEPQPFFREDIEDLKAGFRACVFLHKLINNKLR